MFSVNDVSSLGRRAHYYAELDVSSPAAADTISGNHRTYIYPRKDGQAELA